MDIDGRGETCCLGIEIEVEVEVEAEAEVEVEVESERKIPPSQPSLFRA